MLAHYKDIFMTPGEVENELGVPVLGMIPQIDDEGLRLVRDQNAFSPLMESFRTLRTHLRFATLDRPAKTITFISSIAAEGKSTVTANLAHVMAQDGKRVIVVDGDLRRPTQHKVFDLPIVPGLTDVLGGGRQLATMLRETDNPAIRVLPAGSIPPNPAELLGSVVMADLLRELSALCDVVLVDSPPAVIVADGLLIAHQTDATILVVDEETTKKNVQQSMAMLARARANVIGTVFNRLRLGAGGRGYYYYGKYYVPTEEIEARTKVDDLAEETTGDQE
ncbi:MAG: CpsD/CapB family tyrosine-protein kinase [Capsulimonadales bacterium]|nr:CpsD/CapB family tyrosine-protein kinase [Capsulimonadales bacterium]